MFTKDTLLVTMRSNWEHDGSADWRLRSQDLDVRYLVVRAVNERAALVIAIARTVKCDDLALAALALESYWLARPSASDNEAVLVYPTTAEEATLYRDVPINRTGGSRFTANLEVGHYLDCFIAPVEALLLGARKSIWNHGSDRYGIPSPDDVVSVLKAGCHAGNIIRLLGRFVLERNAKDLLRSLAAEPDPELALNAMDVLQYHGEIIDYLRVFRIASNLQDLTSACLATGVLARAVSDGNVAALDLLFTLIKDRQWLDTVQPTWAHRENQNRESLRAAIMKHYRRT